MKFRYIALICLFLFGQEHQARGGEFRGIGKEIVGAATFALVAVYAGGKVAKDIISDWLYGSKREQESAREAKEKEEREELERQLEWDRQLANQVAAERFAAQRQAEFDAKNKAKTELAQKQTIYRNQISATLQDQESDLIHQFELYQEIEIQELSTHGLSTYQNISGMSTPPHYMVKRVEALRDYLSGKDVWKEETYHISSSGQLLLQEHGIKVADYQTYYGNQIQRALHQEFVDIIHDAADFRFENDHQLENRKNIASTVTQFADVGQMHIRAGYIIDGITYADFCYGILDGMCVIGEVGYDIGTALGKGAWEGAKNFKNKICEPVETIKNTAKSLGRLMLLAARLDQKMEDKMLELQQFNLNRRREDARNLASGKVTKEELRARDEANWKAIKQQLVKDVKASLDSAWQEVNYPNALHALECGTACGVEAFLTGQTFKAVSGFIGKGCASLDEFIEAGHGASTLGQLPCNGSSMQAVITYEAVVAHAAAEAAVEAARVAQVAGIAVAQVLDEASKLAPGLALMQNGPGGPSRSISGTSGNIPNPPIDIIQAIRLIPSEKIIELSNKFDGIRFINGKPIKFRYRHAFEPERSINGTRLLGFHLDPMDFYMRQGLLTNVKMYPGGFYTADVYLGNGIWVKKSFFPNHWSYDEVMNRVISVYDKNQIPTLEGSYAVFQGALDCGVEIRIVIDTFSGECKSFYPDLIGKL